MKTHTLVLILFALLAFSAWGIYYLNGTYEFWALVALFTALAS